MTKSGPERAWNFRRILSGGVLLGLLAGVDGASTAVTWEAGLYASTGLRFGYASTDSLWRAGGDPTLLDANGIVRPLLAADTGTFRFSAEIDAVLQAGDSLGRLPPGIDALPLFSRGRDDNLFDLGRVWSEGDRHRHSLRVDRLAVAWLPDWGSITVGRQAVTWGGGLVFNPFDLFNPFAPDDVVRDYKQGADMVHVDLPLVSGELQLLAVGRRDQADNRASWDASSFAAHYQFPLGPTDAVVFGASHYGEPAVGAGMGGAVGGASWRLEGTWQRTRAWAGDRAREHVSIVANTQYSWVFADRNMFGFLEYYYNGLGHSDYLRSALDPVVGSQIARGNLFVLGRHYAAASLQLEWHPLVNLYWSAIVNLEDPSAVLQPRVAWNASQSLTVTAGIDLPVGKTGSEFGGFELPGTGFTSRNPASVYCLATWFF